MPTAANVLGDLRATSFVCPHVGSNGSVLLHPPRPLKEPGMHVGSVSNASDQWSSSFVFRTYADSRIASRNPTSHCSSPDSQDGVGRPHLLLSSVFPWSEVSTSIHISSKMFARNFCAATAFAALVDTVAGQNLPSLLAPKGAEVLTVGVIGDYGWTGWIPSPDNFCLEVLPALIAAGIEIPNEVTNDCDPGDKQYIVNATALQSGCPARWPNAVLIRLLADTSAYVGQICTLKNCSAFVSPEEALTRKTHRLKLL